MATFALRGVGVHAHHREAVGQVGPQLVLDALGPHAELAQIVATALGADRGNRIGAPAGMAHERVAALVVGQRGRALLALGNEAAVPAQQELGKAALVVQQDGLLPALHHLVERAGKRAGEDRAVPLGELLGHVDHLDARQRARARPLGHGDAGPRRAGELPHPAAAQGLQGGRGAPQHQRRAVEARQVGGHLTGMVARGARLLVGGLVLLVDHIEPGVAQGREQRRAGAHDHAGLSAAHHVPLVEAFAQAEARVQHGHTVAEARPEAAHGLGSERDLGHEHAGVAAGLQGLLDGGQVDLGLSRPRHAVDEHHVAAGGPPGCPYGRQGLALAGGELVFGALGGRGRGEPRGIAGPAHAPPPLHRDDALLRQARHHGRDAPYLEGELHLAHRAVLQGPEHRLLRSRVGTRRIGASLLGEHDPAVVGRGHVGLLERPQAGGLVARHLGDPAGGAEEAHALGKGRGVLARHPQDRLAGRLVEGGLGQDLPDGQHFGRVELRLELGAHAQDVAHRRAAAEVHHDAATGRNLGGQLREHRVGEGCVKRAGGDVDDDLGVARRGQAQVVEGEQGVHETPVRARSRPRPRRRAGPRRGRSSPR